MHSLCRVVWACTLRVHATGGGGSTRKCRLKGLMLRLAALCITLALDRFVSYHTQRMSNMMGPPLSPQRFQRLSKSHSINGMHHLATYSGT